MMRYTLYMCKDQTATFAIANAPQIYTALVETEIQPWDFSSKVARDLMLVALPNADDFHFLFAIPQEIQNEFAKLPPEKRAFKSIGELMEKIRGLGWWQTRTVWKYLTGYGNYPLHWNTVLTRADLGLIDMDSTAGQGPASVKPGQTLIVQEWLNKMDEAERKDLIERAWKATMDFGREA